MLPGSREDCFGAQLCVFVVSLLQFLAMHLSKEKIPSLIMLRISIVSLFAGFALLQYVAVRQKSPGPEAGKSLWNNIISSPDVSVSSIVFVFFGLMGLVELVSWSTEWVDAPFGAILIGVILFIGGFSYVIFMREWNRRREKRRLDKNIVAASLKE